MTHALSQNRPRSEPQPSQKPTTHSTSHSARSIAPSKLILTGEHAVLYHSPALSLAIDLPTYCTLIKTPSASAQFTLTLYDFKLEKSLSFTQWRTQALQIEQRFQAFQAGKLMIDKVLNSPLDLIVICLWVFNQHHTITPADWRLTVQSEAPIGRGLGSSAAVIVTVLTGLLKLHKQPDSSQTLLSLAKQVESYQHGRSSGLDPATLIYGGLLKYQLDQPITPLPSHPINAWLIDTGAPKSHTGECVQAVKNHHQYNQLVWDKFKAASAEIEQAWLQQDTKQLKSAVKLNHSLLCEIGVVPEKVQKFIQQLDQTLNAASKVCGAGSVQGDNAGMVLCLSERAPTKLCQQFGYSFWPLKLHNQGVHCVLD